MYIIDVTLTPLASKLSTSHVTCADAFFGHGVISMIMTHILHEEFLFSHLIHSSALQGVALINSPHYKVWIHIYFYTFQGMKNQPPDFTITMF